MRPGEKEEKAEQDAKKKQEEEAKKKADADEDASKTPTLQKAESPQATPSADADKLQERLRDLESQLSKLNEKIAGKEKQLQIKNNPSGMEALERNFDDDNYMGPLDLSKFEKEIEALKEERAKIVEQIEQVQKEIMTNASQQAPAKEANPAEPAPEAKTEEEEKAKAEEKKAKAAEEAEKEEEAKEEEERRKKAEEDEDEDEEDEEATAGGGDQ